MRALLALCLTLALAAPALAAHTHGKYFLPSHGKRKVTVHRGKRAARKVIRRVYDVRPDTDIYACSRHAVDEVGCDFAFYSGAGEYTCGNARVNANPRRIVVRYVADTGACDDF
ncbi:MAG: hypothetical protein QOF76_287 [Solirubrobacteraceae bacterium]|jgi:hypothetical protein|nr:hypothetical protein [Solirubrobacteraceae bacterium]